MESRVKLFGHPVHPMLVVFPVGLFATAVIFDILHLATDNPILAAVSFYMLAAGVVGGLLAAIFGLIDWLARDGQRDDRRFICSELAAAWQQSQFCTRSPGSTIVLRWDWSRIDHSLGVDPGANVNAPNSLTESSTAPTKRTANR